MKNKGMWKKPINLLNITGQPLCPITTKIMPKAFATDI